MLETRNIVFSYPGAQAPLYDGLSFVVDINERVALRAPSGFGKTTLCRLLAGFEQPSSGEVLFDGKPLPRSGVCPVQMIGQHPELAVDPRMRMRDTLAEAGDVSAAVLDALGIKQAWLNRFPHELSGGELQRFCIARAVAAQPRYLIADEISTMLDAVTQAQIWAFLLDYVKSNAVGLVFVSHSPALTKRIATRTVALDKDEDLA
ncbi:MAG: ATP-binding cassette domain-containing protein [Eggerthellaceae bacterium]|nr:ATP-binding cassette domain-containing protein [Eggerthellaceae bacterium]